jgi:hypothetical protein
VGDDVRRSASATDLADGEVSELVGVITTKPATVSSLLFQQVQKDGISYRFGPSSSSRATDNRAQLEVQNP